MTTDPTPYTPTDAMVREAYRHYQAQAGVPGEYEAEYDRWLAARDARVRAEQQEVDLAMHRAYRAEVVAEVAVCLDDDADWDRIATWCGARIDTTQDPSGEYTSALVLPDGQYGWRGSWIVKRLDGTFAVREGVEAPDADTLARVRAEAVREARSYIERLHPRGLNDRGAVLADLEIAADRLGRGIHANGRARAASIEQEAQQ